MEVSATTNRPVTDDPGDPAPAGSRGAATVWRGDVVGILSRVSGVLADAALGLPLRATPYTVQRAVPVAMPDRGDAPR